jgi:hypothetical protein
MLVSRGLLMERRFLPRPVSVGELLRGVPLQGLPPLEGFVLTYLKNGAEMNLGAPFNSPLLATWRYGLGRAAAFTSDLTGRWGAAWLGWEGFPRFAAQLARWIQRPAPSDLLHPRVRLSSGTGGITVDAYDELGSFVDGLDLRADIQDPSGERREVPLRQSAPGMYAAEFPANAAGDYEVTLWEADRPELGARTLAASLSYPEEFRDSGVNAGLLSAIARASGGTVLSLAEAGGGAWQELTRPDREPRTAGLPLWPYLLAAGLLAFFLDIAARRLVVPDRLASRLASLGRRTRGMGSGELAGMVAAARQREQEGRRLRERISATAAEGKIDPELAAYLYIARLKSQERERQEK